MSTIQHHSHAQQQKQRSPTAVRASNPSTRPQATPFGHHSSGVTTTGGAAPQQPRMMHFAPPPPLPARPTQAATVGHHQSAPDQRQASLPPPQYANPSSGNASHPHPPVHTLYAQEPIVVTRVVHCSDALARHRRRGAATEAFAEAKFSELNLSTLSAGATDPAMTPVNLSKDDDDDCGNRYDSFANGELLEVIAGGGGADMSIGESLAVGGGRGGAGDVRSNPSPVDVPGAAMEVARRVPSPLQQRALRNPTPLGRFAHDPYAASVEDLTAMARSPVGGSPLLHASVSMSRAESTSPVSPLMQQIPLYPPSASASGYQQHHKTSPPMQTLSPHQQQQQQSPQQRQQSSPPTHQQPYPRVQVHVPTPSATTPAPMVVTVGTSGRRQPPASATVHTLVQQVPATAATQLSTQAVHGHNNQPQSGAGATGGSPTQRHPQPTYATQHAHHHTQQFPGGSPNTSYPRSHISVGGVDVTATKTGGGSFYKTSSPTAPHPTVATGGGPMPVFGPSPGVALRGAVAGSPTQAGPSSSASQPSSPTTAVGRRYVNGRPVPVRNALGSGEM